jgi:23S rRNA (cytidine1920-2'-O)/16S rRNA (cytidine1409-2'-O)-methyltransferase
VVGVDVGHGQLHERLRSDARVTCLEKVNARELSTAQLQGLLAADQSIAENQRQSSDGWQKSLKFDVVVGDLSFISLTLVLPALLPLLAADGDLLMLVKPQFELQPQDIGKGGLVKDPASYELVKQRIRQACQDHGLSMRDYFESAITGGDGNREFFVWACP